MITTSQKARLCEMAQQLKPIFEIGKNGIGGKEIIDISIALDSHELIKISVSHDAPNDAKTFLNAICALTGAEPVIIIGNEVVIYDCSLLSDTKPCHILPLLFFNRSFISATFSSDKSPLPLNTPVDFCKYSSAVILPVFLPATLPSVVMYLYTFSPPIISKKERSALWASLSNPLAFLPSSYGVYFIFRIIG